MDVTIDASGFHGNNASNGHLILQWKWKFSPDFLVINSNSIYFNVFFSFIKGLYQKFGFKSEEFIVNFMINIYSTEI